MTADTIPAGTIADVEPTAADAFVAALASRMLVKVADFNREITALPVPSFPSILSPARLESSLEAMNEELNEFAAATETGDILEAADGLIDLVYFALGRLYEMGVPAQAVFDEVHRANMDKEQGTKSTRSGWVGRDAVKPQGWMGPRHEWLGNFSFADVEELALLREQARLRETMSPIWIRLQELRESKGQDYNNVPGGRDAYFPFGHQSYAHMLTTKNLRIQSLINSAASGRPVNHESLLDTVVDLVNYSTYYAEAIQAGKLSQLGNEVTK